MYLGLVNRLIEDDQALEAALDLAAKGPLALGASPHLDSDRL